MLGEGTGTEMRSRVRWGGQLCLLSGQKEGFAPRDFTVGTDHQASFPRYLPWVTKITHFQWLFHAVQGLFQHFLSAFRSCPLWRKLFA